MFGYRPVMLDDVELLHRWHNMPHVSRWWQPSHPSLADVRHEITQIIKLGSGVAAYIVTQDETPIGFIQKWQVRAFPDYRAYIALDDAATGVDVFIGEADKLHRGLGTRIIQQFLADYVFDDETVPEAIIDPLPGNAVAIRAYEKVGFRHAHTFVHDGTPVYLMRLSRAVFVDEVR